MNAIPTLNGVPIEIEGKRVDIVQEVIDRTQCQHRFNDAYLIRQVIDRGEVKEFIYRNLCLDCRKLIDIDRQIVDAMSVIQRHQIPDE